MTFFLVDRGRSVYVGIHAGDDDAGSRQCFAIPVAGLLRGGRTKFNEALGGELRVATSADAVWRAALTLTPSTSVALSALIYTKFKIGMSRELFIKL